MGEKDKANAQLAENETLKREAQSIGIYSSESPSIPIEMIKVINLEKKRANYRFALFTSDGGWIVCPDNGVYSRGLPSEPLENLKKLTNNFTFYEKIRHAAFSPQGAWFFHFGVNEAGFRSNNLPPKLLNTLTALYARAKPSGFRNVILSIAFAPNGGWVLVYKEADPPPSWGGRPRNNWKALWENVPETFVEKIKELEKQQASVRVIFPPTGGWLILQNNMHFTHENISNETADLLGELRNNGKRIYDVAFASDGAWLVVADPLPYQKQFRAKTAVPTISGGVLNGKATSLPRPIYPDAAKAVGAAGAVSVQVLISENGDIISAKALSGHPLLRAAAAAAAREAKFLPFQV
ncbi:MAG: TonB family protein, partial [Pyrinomonadaceae bacterium]